MVMGWEGTPASVVGPCLAPSRSRAMKAKQDQHNHHDDGDKFEVAEIVPFDLVCSRLPGSCQCPVTSVPLGHRAAIGE